MKPGFFVAISLLAASANVACAAMPTAVSETTDAAPAPDLVAIKGEWQQGNLIFGKTTPGNKVSYNGRDLRLTPEGDFLIALDRSEKQDAVLSVQAPGSEAVTTHYTVVPRDWDVQRIDGLPQGKVNPPAKSIKRILKEQALIKAARHVDSDRTDFLQPFIWPATGRISGVFGSQRILNGTPKNPHYGVDVAVPTGTPVHAPNSGVVSLAQPDMYYTGGTIMVDHGHGLSTIVVHLSKVLVKVGDVVTQGQVLGLSGMTGRATGPHVHWGVNWFDSKIDPQRLVPALSASSGD